MESMLWTRLTDGRLCCGLCAHACVLSPGQRGRCGVRCNHEGQPLSLVDGLVTGVQADPVEKKPLYHFLPGSRTFSVGSAGCNFSCRFCQNHHISRDPLEQERIRGHEATPEMLVEAALRTACRSLAFTYNEPTVFVELLAATAALGQERGLPSILVSNGFMSPGCLELLGPMVRAANIDLKAFSEDFYHHYCGARLRPVLDNLVRMRALGRTLSEMSKAGVSIDRLLYILGAEPEKGPEAPAAANLSGDIRFEHVSFAYAQKKVLDDVSFTVKGGSTLGVFGETGSGKSTIALLLARLYDPGEGRITIGGVDVRDMNPSELRRGVGVVLQEPFLFSRTVAQNIAITRENVSQDEIEQAAREACLHDAIGSFQAGYETVVGERGVTLSGGQKQRTAIARTLLEHAPIMVFDDALSAVDAKTDEAIRGRLREAAGGSTMILIAHRVATLMQADQIIVLRDGRIVEQGAPEALLAQGGLFARTARMQSAEGEEEAE